jgi:hypothetical protein
MPSGQKSPSENDYDIIQVKRKHLHLAHADGATTLEKEFRGLLKRWRKDTQFKSSIIESVMHPDYQRIVDMGSSVVPLLLKELESDPDQWFWALCAITGANPVAPEDAGSVPKMNEAWLKWGKRQGLV